MRKKFKFNESIISIVYMETYLYNWHKFIDINANGGFTVTLHNTKKNINMLCDILLQILLLDKTNRLDDYNELLDDGVGRFCGNYVSPESIPYIIKALITNKNLEYNIFKNKLKSILESGVRLYNVRMLDLIAIKKMMR